MDVGQLVRIHGWVNIPAPIAGSVNGLMVVNSLGGDDLAERFDETVGWKELPSIAPPRSRAGMGVTFVLSGLGEARLDNLTIEVMVPRPPEIVAGGGISSRPGGRGGLLLAGSRTNATRARRVCSTATKTIAQPISGGQSQSRQANPMPTANIRALDDRGSGGVSPRRTTAAANATIKAAVTAAIRQAKPPRSSASL